MNASICMICHKKNNSDSLRQLKKIRNYLQKNQYTEKERKYGLNIANAFIISTHNHCPYGLSCSSLSNMESEANNIAMSIENEIIAFVQNVDRAKLYELLRFTQGYFPQAYRVIERYWYEFNKE